VSYTSRLCIAVSKPLGSFSKTKITVMKNVWFRPGEILLLRSILWMFLLVLAIAFMIPVYKAVLRNDHAVGDELYPPFVCGIGTAFWW
jgi:hypothetical protein